MQQNIQQVRLFYFDNNRLKIAKDIEILREVPLSDFVWIDLNDVAPETESELEQFLKIYIQEEEEIEEIEMSSRYIETADTMVANSNFLLDTYDKEPVSFILKNNILVSVRDNSNLKSFNETVKKMFASPRNYPTGYHIFVALLETRVEYDADMIEEANSSITKLSKTLTMAEDVDFTWFYNSSSLYAPAIMFDRAPYADGLASIVFEGNDSKLVNNAMKVFPTKEPFISIQLNNKFDASTRQGTLEVEVYTFVNPTEAEHRLNLHLVQDDMVATQSGMGSNYVHHHVFRGCLNGTWGETIELIEGTTVKKTVEYTIPEKIISTHANKVSLEAILENMQIVAFVSDAANSPLECIVWNSESIPVLQSADGIGELQANSALTVDVCGQTLRLPSVGNRALVYAISGQTVASFASGESCTLPKGTYVVKVYGKNGETAVKKIIL